MADNKIKFDELPESKDVKYLKSAGIHIGFELTDAEFTTKEIKDGKVKNGALKLTFTAKDKEETVQFTAFLWEPPSNTDDVKFTGDVYEKGVAIRKRTPAEEIQHQFHSLFYYYEQLAKAIHAPAEKQLSFRKSIGGEPNELWKKLYDEFFTRFPLESFKGKLIDFKALFENSDKNKTSFLGIARASQSNKVFTPTIDAENKKASLLDIQSGEVKKLVQKYKPQDRAPQGNGTEIQGDAANWKPGGDDAAAGTAAEPVTQVGDLKANEQGDFF